MPNDALSGEQLTDATIAYLKAHLPARIAAINAERGDFELKVPADTAYKAGGDFLHATYPHVEVATPDEDFTEPDIVQAGWIGSGRLVVSLWAQEFSADGGEKLYRTLQRYGGAILAELLQQGALGGSVIVRRAARRVRFDPEAGTKESATGGVLVLLQLERAAQRP